jgi:hypothetical protein
MRHGRPEIAGTALGLAYRLPLWTMRETAIARALIVSGEPANAETAHRLPSVRHPERPLPAEAHEAVGERGKSVPRKSIPVAKWARRWSFGLTSVAVISLGLCGCAGFWDEVTSNDFDVSDFFNRPNPLLVLKESTDGDKRAQALSTLREPKQNGGTDQEQDFVLTLLVTAASNERQPLCRLKAINSLGHFKDPRAVKGLEDAYYKAVNFPTDTAATIRCQAITAMGETKNPEAVRLLVRFVGQKPVEGTEQEKRQNLDERIAAARALGNFQQYQATEALVVVLQRDKDVALRDCAHDSLKTITGKDLPADAKAWEAFLHENVGKDVVVKEETSFGKITGWFQFGN